MLTEWIDNLRPTNPALNGILVALLRTLYGGNPIQNVRQLLYGKIQSTDVVTFNGLTNVHPPYMVISWNGHALILIGGTSGNIHLDKLLAGWRNPSRGPGSQFGISEAFGLAAQSIIDAVGPDQFAGVERFYVAGHSYGGAVAQALAVILRPMATRGVKVWSYGAPRPGTARLQTFLGTMTNTRFFCDDDPVRFIPPHSDEVPSLTLLDSWDLVRGCNQQVQSPEGYMLEANGNIVRTEGNPTPLNAVGLSVASWVLDWHGFRSVLHALDAYQQRFDVAETLGTPTVIPGPNLQKEQPLQLNRVEKDRIERIGEAQVNADLALPNPTLNNFAVPPNPRLSRIRYVRRKIGRVWGVKYDGEVVAIGPGKRVSGKMARDFNRAALRDR